MSWKHAEMAPAPTRFLVFDGYRLAYRVSGQGPPLVLLSQYWRGGFEALAQRLRSHWQVFQVTPIGYGESERVAGYAGEAMADQVAAVVGQHQVDRYVVAGYSAGAAMAACVARANPRVAGLICGGFALEPATPGHRRQLDRRLAPDHPSRTLWAWFGSMAWPEELAVMSCPRLVFWGSEDHQMAPRLRRLRQDLTLQEVDFEEFPGYDHASCCSQEALAGSVLPSIQAWAGAHLPDHSSQ